MREIYKKYIVSLVLWLHIDSFMSKGSIGVIKKIKQETAVIKRWQFYFFMLKN